MSSDPGAAGEGRASARESGTQGAGAVVVSTEWLAAKLVGLDPALRIVDLRGTVLPPGAPTRYLAKRSDYDHSHIPGAVFVDWTSDIVDRGDPVPLQLASPEAFAVKMEQLGIGDQTLVVAYDDHDHIFAGRFAWALRYYGHDAVRILDGGWSRWTSEARPTESTPTDASAPTSGPPRPAAGMSFHPHPVPALRRTADDVARCLGQRDVLLIDARPSEQYAGAVTAASRAGHIPGAVNVPYSRLVDPASKQFISPAEMARAFADAGVDVHALPRDVIVYCNGGVSCTVALHALRMLGRQDVAVYDGSWNEWGNDTSRPIRAGHLP